MPMVSAAGYPTQEAPTVSPSPTPGADYQSIPAATPNAFGAQVGVAQERLGSAFEQAGTGLAQAAVERQQLTNQVASDQATNYTMDQVTKILHGDPNVPGDVGFYGKKGIDAVNSRQSTAQALDEIINKTRGTLSNARQQLTFDNETRRMRNYWMGEIGRHYDQQLTQSAVNSAKAGQDLAGQGMSSAAANGDMQGFSLFTEQMMKAKLREGQAQGWTQEQYDAALGDTRAVATKLWVESTAVKDPAAAKEFLEHNKDALRGDEYAQLSRMVKDHHDAAVADKFVSGMQGRGGGLVRGGAIQGAINTEGTGEGHVVAKIERLAYYKQKAAELGLNFDAVAATVAGEGLGKYTGDGGTSHGDFQLHTGGGMGDAALQAGINIRDPKTWKQQADFALEQMAQHKGNAEWYAGQWHGAPAWAASAFSNTGGTPDTTTPTQTGAQAIPAAAGATVPQTRSGVMPLDQQFDEIDKSSLSDDQKRIAKDNATKRTSALEMAAQRAERLRVEHDRQQVQAAADEVAKDVYSANPKITPQMIANDPRLSSNFAMRDHLIRFVNDPPGSSVPTHQSNALAMSLIERMQPNYDKPDKITSMEQIMEQTKGLNRSDWTFVNNQFHAQQQLGGETIRQQRAELLANYKGQIVGLIADPHINSEGFARLYRYEHFIQSRVDEYQKAGKNPQELFDPKSPNFLANPETLKSFGPTAHDLTKAQGNAAVDLTKIPFNDLAAGVTQGKFRRDLVVLEVERRLRAGEMQNPQAVPIR
jgi:hypothetical protein